MTGLFFRALMRVSREARWESVVLVVAQKFGPNEVRDIEAIEGVLPKRSTAYEPNLGYERYRGASLIRKRSPPGPYRTPMLRVLGKS